MTDPVVVHFDSPGGTVAEFRHAVDNGTATRAVRRALERALDRMGKRYGTQRREAAPSIAAWMWPWPLTWAHRSTDLGAA